MSKRNAIVRHSQSVTAIQLNVTEVKTTVDAFLRLCELIIKMYLAQVPIAPNQCSFSGLRVFLVSGHSYDQLRNDYVVNIPEGTTHRRKILMTFLALF